MAPNTQSILLQLSNLYVFIMDSLKLPMTFFAETENSILKFTWSLKGPQIAKKMLK